MPLTRVCIGCIVYGNVACCRLLGAANADILQLSNTFSGPARLHLVSGDELRVITRSDEPLENLLSVC